MKVLVTGSNGLLGHQVVFELLKNRHEVSIIVRSKKNIYFDLQAIDTVIEGNFTDYKTLKTAAESCDAIIHVAAVTATDLLHYDDYARINVDGSATVLKVAEELNIKRLIFVSTANTIGFGSKNKLSEETSDIEFPFSESYYAQSKLEAEQLFKKASLLPDRHVIIVNPTFLIGSFDTKPSSGKLMLMGYKKRIMFAPGGGKNFVAASDVAVTICNALTQGKNGERYLALGVNLSFKEFYTLQQEIGNYKQYLIQLPDFLLKAVGKVGDIIRRFGIKTEVCSRNIRQLLVQEYYSNAKAKSELSMPETALKTAIGEALDWFKETEKIK
ncbi:MAG: NAD-dependent epimerase/dehydratase family protein [Paludibacter sp.]|nr:NAD-dependent epimerase/dehydratase family protein [Paludibacter sp.]